MALIIAHIGAGNHGTRHKNEYKQLIRHAVRTPDNEGINAIIKSSKVLESSPLVNSGYGCSLNMIGKAANDACLLQYAQDKMTQYKVVYNIDHKHPISEVQKLYENIEKLYHQKKYHKIGLTPPKIIDYSVKSFLHESLGLEIDSETAISAKESELYGIFKQGLLLDSNESDCHSVTDTIGIIHAHDGVTTLASSSGGNFLKLPGRVGCAAVIGGGISHQVFAAKEETIGGEQSTSMESTGTSTGTKSISCMCSGNGEDIIMMKMADYVIDLFHHDLDITQLHEQLTQKWNTIHTTNGKLYVGIIIVIQQPNHKTQIIYYHTTETFYFGFNNGSTRVITSTKGNHPYLIGEYNIDRA